MSGRVRGVVVLASAVLAAGATVLGTTAATGAPESPSVPAADQTAGREITRFDVAAELGTDGVLARRQRQERAVARVVPEVEVEVERDARDAVRAELGGYVEAGDLPAGRLVGRRER